ncbi:hypothetical protein CSV71_10450 [Sporosarcina sp. P21c]|uniref:DUF3139 domain-containing protein n=1 Tax=unclassified Sporosarcina TaxID=2647733 RepID=UPI000C16E472|nr:MULTISPECIES: DUF3139 domain-containing protein [unclassified Sporosarcina]PIC67620.1 hypothetical protein CSV78_06865 [Sporosarcina sp. P16a]PIC83579.1 hypothetical protein CSV73_06645 [Sporosarcina sp. P1]PIC89334.1 hypothetical protein CSV71_10450 [Sporosarcina sp. P21c]PIC93071.1 hypothetical protein CSV70_07615 [Sporosarcina sp. P25]
MSPSSVILFMILVAPLILLLIVALFWKKVRTILLVLAIVVASVETYYVMYKQESSLQEWYEHEDIVNAYLEKTYPEDDWVSRYATRSAFSSAGVEVVFIDELEVAYLYIVEDGDVNLVGYSSKEGYENPKRSQ